MIGNNNPFNIRMSNNSYWRGQIGVTRGFCDFTGVWASVRVVLYLFLRTYRKLNILTLSDCIHRFCPSGDGANNPDRYVEFLCDERIHAVDYVSCYTADEWFLVLSRMALIESGYILSQSDFFNGFFAYGES